jgi:hypothetical protein
MKKVVARPTIRKRTLPIKVRKYECYFQTVYMKLCCDIYGQELDEKGFSLTGDTLNFA